jgi:hypothetical protein
LTADNFQGHASNGKVHKYGSGTPELGASVSSHHEEGMLRSSTEVLLATICFYLYTMPSRINYALLLLPRFVWRKMAPKIAIRS